MCRSITYHDKKKSIMTADCLVVNINDNDNIHEIFTINVRIQQNTCVLWISTSIHADGLNPSLKDDCLLDNKLIT